MTPQEARQFVESLARFGMRFGLERTARVLRALGSPDRRLRVLHVAGTNGKGSTCAFAASILRAAGVRTGLYTSPHLVRVNERIQVDGREITDEAFALGVQAVLDVYPGVRDGEDPLTFFEVGTLIALWHFAREGVEVAVLEVGLGGRLDATNVVLPEATAVTRIALDHTGVLGESLAEIAAEKAGIFKPGASVVLARQEPEALRVLEERARDVGQVPARAGVDFELAPQGPEGEYRFVGASGRTIERLRLSLAGPHQRENAETAVQAALAVQPTLTDEQVRRGLAEARWPGRLEIVDRDPLTLLDGAHNPNGAEALARSMAALYPGARVHLVFGVLGDKDVEGIASLLLPLASRAYLASPASERALPLDRLRELASRHGEVASAHASVGEALEAARAAAREEGPGALVLVAGSLYVVGEARAALLRG